MAALSVSHSVSRRVPAIRKVSLTSRTIAKKIAEFADEKKAFDISVLDMRKLVNFCDYFVISSGNTDRQVKAIADAIDEGLFALGIRVGSKNSMKQSDWVVFDTGDIVIHVFQKKTREFYNLEYLWQDAKEVKWKKESQDESK